MVVATGSRRGAFQWTRLNAILQRHPLPPARIVHRLYATASELSRKEPDAGNWHVRICEGWGWQHPHLLGLRQEKLRRGE